MRAKVQPEARMRTAVSGFGSLAAAAASPLAESGESPCGAVSTLPRRPARGAAAPSALLASEACSSSGSGAGQK